MTENEPEWLRDKRRREEETREPFERLCLGRLSLARYTRTGELPVFRAVREAAAALRNFRDARSQSRGAEYEEEKLAIRVVADHLAREITAAAGPERDAATIAWVVAGLTCPETPFCLGCPACQTITSPDRQLGDPRLGIVTR